MKYTNIIPFNSLWILNQYDPDLKIQSFKGNGSGGSTQANLEIEMENIRIGKMKIRTTTEAELIYNFDRGELKISQILKILRDRTGLPDANLEKMAYVERDCKFGHPELRTILIEMERVTVNPGVYKKLVMDGKYPLQGIHEMLQGFSDSLSTVPPEIKKRFKPSCLMIKKTNPNVLDDDSIVFALKRPYMMFMSETTKAWDLFDLDYRKRGGPKK